MAGLCNGCSCIQVVEKEGGWLWGRHWECHWRGYWVVGCGRRGRGDVQQHLSRGGGIEGIGLGCTRG